MNCFHLISDAFKLLPWAGSPRKKSKLTKAFPLSKPTSSTKMCREEFRLRNFKLWHPILLDFTHSRWLSLPFFLAYRLIVTGYNFAWLIYNIYLYKAKLFIFLTNWTYLILNLYFLQATTLTFSALCCAHRMCRATSPSINEKQDTSVEVEMGSGDESANAKEKATEEAREGDALRFHHKIFWLLYIISANAGLLVTAGYWTVLYEDDEPIDANNITKHALNSVFMLIDTFLSSIPVLLFHSVYPLLYIIIYLAFTVAYWQLGGTNLQGNPYIYKLLDYDNIEPSTGCLVGFFLLVVQPILQLILFGLVKLRDHLRPTHKTD